MVLEAGQNLLHCRAVSSGLTVAIGFTGFVGLIVHEHQART
jgi:hypothetical protein